MRKTLRKKRHGLSGKLLLLFVIMALAFVMFVGGGIRHALDGKSLKQNFQVHIVTYLDYIKADIGDPPNRERAKQLAEHLNIEIQIFDDSGGWSSSGKVTSLANLENESEHTIDGGSYIHVSNNEDQHYLMARNGDTTLLFNLPKKQEHDEEFRGWIPIVILLVLLLVLYSATRRLFSPINTIKRGVEKFGAGDMNYRITVNRTDELGELAESFNTMAGDIQKMLEAKRQLLLAISHELRSPLTRSRVAAEMLNDSNNKTQIVSDINEMETLIEELIETERLNSRHTKLNKQQCDIAALVKEVVCTWHNEAGITIEQPKETVVLDIDIARIKLLLKNLLDNAVTHTPTDAAPPEVRLTLENKQTVITINDHGKGIDAQHLPHLAEPFYRADASRHRETGGYGLGLYLCKMIAEAHGGMLEIDSELGVGTCVRVRLPVSGG